MKNKFLILAAVSTAIAAAVFGGRQWHAARRTQAAAQALAQADQWDPAARRAAHVMVERYGPPQETSASELRWNGPPPWKRIVVQDEPQEPLEEVVTYPVTEKTLAALNRFPHGLSVYAAEGALGASSDREYVNLLSLNLADEIATGKITPEEANRYFVRTVRLREAGKSSPYTERLLFKNDNHIEPDNTFPIP